MTLLTSAALLLICIAWLSAIVSHIHLLGQVQDYSSFYASKFKQHVESRPTPNATTHRLQPKSTSASSLKQHVGEGSIHNGKRSPIPNASTNVIDPKPTSLAGLSCENHGGPHNQSVQEMVYWRDYPQDNTHTSPFYSESETRYLTFEPDQGGWNNIRMALETVLVMAFAMGRTLVLPPANPIYLLNQGNGDKTPRFSFADFFDMLAIHKEHKGLNIITMEEFLNRQLTSERPLLRLPGNRTNWDGDADMLYGHLQAQAKWGLWDPDSCIAYFPDSSNNKNPHEYQELYKQVRRDFPTNWRHYFGKPARDGASVKERLAEFSAGRNRLCIYGPKSQNEPILHFPTEIMNVENVKPSDNPRLLVHFYAFLFFENIHHDLWSKRFVRDHVRYSDSIQCAAARVVLAMRERVRTVHGHPDGIFHSMHIRRGDFQYKETRVSVQEIYNATRGVFEEGDIVYIATDEKDKSFFLPLKEHYEIYFLDNFIGSGVVDGNGPKMSANHYGMLDQLIASRGGLFVGCFFSSFTGYINRLRGYHSELQKHPGYKDAKLLTSYYYAPARLRLQLHHYVPVKQPFWASEFPTAWHNIDRDVHDDA